MANKESFISSVERGKKKAQRKKGSYLKVGDEKKRKQKKGDNHSSRIKTKEGKRKKATIQLFVKSRFYCTRRAKRQKLKLWFHNPKRKKHLESGSLKRKQVFVT